MKMDVQKHIPTAVLGIIGGATLVIGVAISVLFFRSVEPNYSEPWLILSGVCSLGYAAGAMMYRHRNRRAALGFVAGMVGWATVFLGVATLNRGIIGSSLVSLVPAGLMLLGVWYYNPDTR
jgi:hypothetical protein